MSLEREVPGQKRLPPRRSCGCDAPAPPRGPTAAAIGGSSQQPGHFAGVVLVDAVKSHQWIEQQESRPQPFGRFQEPRAVRIAVQPQRGGRDHVNFDPARSSPRWRAIPATRSRTTGKASSAR